MRLPAALVALAFLLAGCSGGGGDGDGASPGPGSSTSASTGPPPPPVPTTDTLHLLQGPEVSTMPPAGSDLRTPVGFGDGGPDGNQAPPARWAHVVKAPVNVTGGEVRVWVEVLEPMVEVPSQPGTQCTWRLVTAIGGDTQPLTNCVNEPPGPISPGVKELAFTLVLQGPVELEPGETITVTLSRNAFSLSPNNAVDALSGSAEHDSRIQLRGLREPVGP